MVAIEIDGGAHEIPGVAERDRSRQQLLEAQSIRFIRIDAGTVETNIHAALAEIERELGFS